MVIDYYTALYRSTFGNPDLKWEKTLQWDAGVDVSVLNQRIDLSLDYYYKKTRRLIIGGPDPGNFWIEYDHAEHRLRAEPRF